jgi:hypothetical protein
MEAQYCIQKLINEFKNKNEFQEKIYNPYYLIYNMVTNKIAIKFNNTTTENEICSPELLDDETTIDLFICKSHDNNCSFVEILSGEIAEKRIHEYYEFFNLSALDINSFQEYSSLSGCNFQHFEATMTEFWCKSNPNLDSFKIIHLELN